ncbi:MAG: di-heme-cytochrome C peroxidase [Pseudomonadota bacterium]
MIVAAIAAAACLAAPATAQPVEWLDQGWSPSERQRWHAATQGSRLLPLEWFVALEQPGSEALFLDPAHMQSLRYPLGHVEALGVRLPIGFALDDQSDETLNQTRLRWRDRQDDRATWVGLNCSACHTGQINYRGRTYGIDGAPALADFQGFIERLNLAYAQTLNDPAKWRRFGDRVLGRNSDAEARDNLRRVFVRNAEWQGLQLRVNNPNPSSMVRYLYGRLDAFGHIFNRVALLATDPPDTPDIAAARDELLRNPNPADAPVSYPFLWNINRLTHVQYNGIASNAALRRWDDQGEFDIGALGRNVGQVTGVFADVTLRRNAGLVEGYSTSADIANLVRIEQQLTRLRPPAWPASFPPLNPALVEAGRAEFVAQGCNSCHLPLPSNRNERVADRISTFRPNNPPAPEDPARGIPPGTDPWMACNAYTYRAPAGLLEGTRAGFISGDRIGADADLHVLLRAVVGGSLVGTKWYVVGTAFAGFLYGDRPPRVVTPPPGQSRPLGAQRDADRLTRCMNEATTEPLLGYKARPLDGIWATGPYLHNGSVLNLYELLLPPADRSRSFRVGTREFDPVHVGFSGSSDAPGNTMTFSTSERGNSNAGHDYGNARLTPAQRRALVEYMKSL